MWSYLEPEGQLSFRWSRAIKIIGTHLKERSSPHFAVGIIETIQAERSMQQGHVRKGSITYQNVRGLDLLDYYTQNRLLVDTVV